MKKISSLFLIAILSLVSSEIIGAQERTVEIVKNGQVVFSLPAAEIEYLTVVNRLPIPKNVRAAVSQEQIVISWDEVKGASSYKIFRSNDGNNFEAIGSSNSLSYIDKTPLSGMNYYRVQAIGEDDALSELSEATSPVLTNSQDGSGIYLGIIGFNQALYNQPISLLTDISKASCFNFIDGLNTKKGTLLYYSVDQAITTLKERTYPSDLFNVAIVTFTDGLDQGSFMMESRYSTDEEYLEAINRRITSETIANVPITAYSIGIWGNDVSDINKFRLNLSKLASSDENAKEVTSMAEVNQKFKEIAQNLVETNSVHTITLNMPGLANGTRVRFTFDNVTNANSSNLYIEGTFNLSNKSLSNVEYHGMSSTSGAIVHGEVNGIFVKFKFEGVRTETKKPLPSNYICEYTYIASTGSWQINSEFDKDEGSSIVTEHRSAAIMLVIDCSSSLESDFEGVQENAKGFIDILVSSNNEGDNDEITENTSDLPSDNLSTTPTHLNLCVTRNGKIYYMTPEEYENSYNPSIYTKIGLTLVYDDCSFILTLNNTTTAPISYDTAYTLYANDMPDMIQGRHIADSWSSINYALSQFGGTQLSSNNNHGTWVSNGNSGDSHYYIYQGKLNLTDPATEFANAVMGYSATNMHYIRNVLLLE